VGLSDRVKKSTVSDFPAESGKIHPLMLTKHPQPRRTSYLFAVLFLLGAVAWPSTADEVYPGETWARAESPEARGWSSEKLQEAQAYAGTIDTAAVVVVDDGVVVAEWGETTRKFKCHSIRKSFLSALYGIHAAEGRIDLARTLEELGINDNDSLTAAERQATVAELLKARSGIYHPALYETAAMKARRPRRGSHRPGTFWYYNNWDFNVLGTIFEQETGTNIFEEFQRRVAGPLEMQDFEVADGEYFGGPESIHPAYPFRMTARDMARFGLLFLRQGRWRDEQIVPADWVEESWVEESTRTYSDAGRGGGYGYMWWVAVEGKHLPGMQLPEGAYSARGHRGHYILVIPSEKLVVVHRVNTDERGPQVNPEQFGRLVQLIREARLHEN
jgi:CubicO group peptidase (beta-lactamase class C family)